MKQKVILIAEDDSSNFLVNKYFLNKLYEVKHAIDGLDVIEKCESLCPDLILMDIRMPNLNGIEAMKRIKSKHPDLPIIAITAFADFDEEKIFLDYGFDGFIAKPVDKATFKKIIESKLVE